MTKGVKCCPFFTMNNVGIQMKTQKHELGLENLFVAKLKRRQEHPLPPILVHCVYLKNMNNNAH